MNVVLTLEINNYVDTYTKNTDEPTIYRFTNTAVKLNLPPRYVQTLYIERLFVRNDCLGCAVTTFPLLVLVYLAKDGYN